METPNVQGAAVAAQVAPQTNTEFKVPEGKVVVDAPEYETLKRNNERIRGMETHYQTATKYGFKKPEDFEPVGRLRETLEKRKMSFDDVQDILRIIKDDPEEGVEAAKQAGMSQKDIQKMISDAIQGDRTERAWESHQAALESERAAIRKATDALLGEGASELDREVWADHAYALSRNAEFRKQHGEMYPDKHPLHEQQWAPYSEKGLAALTDALKKKREAAAGASMASKAKDAAKKLSATPGGKVPSSGTTESEGSDDPRARHDARWKAIAAKT